MDQYSQEVQQHQAFLENLCLLWHLKGQETLIEKEVFMMNRFTQVYLHIQDIALVAFHSRKVHEIFKIQLMSLIVNNFYSSKRDLL